METNALSERWLQSERNLSEAITNKNRAKRRMCKCLEEFGLTEFDAKKIASIYLEYMATQKELEKRRKERDQAYKEMKSY